MDQDIGGSRTTRFASYLGDLANVLGDGRRVGPLTSYCTGLLLPADRKSVEPPDLSGGRTDGTGPDGGAAPVDVAFRRPG